MIFSQQSSIVDFFSSHDSSHLSRHSSCSLGVEVSILQACLTDLCLYERTSIIECSLSLSLSLSLCVLCVCSLRNVLWQKRFCSCVCVLQRQQRWEIDCSDQIMFYHDASLTHLVFSSFFLRPQTFQQGKQCWTLHMYIEYFLNNYPPPPHLIHRQAFTVGTYPGEHASRRSHIMHSCTRASVLLKMTRQCWLSDWTLFDLLFLSWLFWDFSSNFSHGLRCGSVQACHRNWRHHKLGCTHSSYFYVKPCVVLCLSGSYWPWIVGCFSTSVSASLLCRWGS